MIKSMTSYGRGECAEAHCGYVVEIKSVNHRFCDITVKQPRELAQFEERVKERVRRYAARGKIDVFVAPVAGIAPEVTVKADTGLVRAYVDAINAVNADCGTDLVLDARTLMAIPGALTAVPAESDPEEVWRVLETALDAAGEQFAAMRRREGEKLAEALSLNGDRLAVMLEAVKERAPLIPGEFKRRLEERIAELERNACDPQRIAAEVAIFADRCCIDEEIVRLGSHLGQLKALIASDDAVGKQLDFLVQEMNREVNTIGSKANDLTLTNTVLAMKNEVEKLREQIQNVE